MKKLQLQVETLHVESFPTQTETRGTGTVHAHSDGGQNCVSFAYYGCYSGTCNQSEQCTQACEDDTWGQTQTNCSQQCSRNTCVGCTNEN